MIHRPVKVAMTPLSQTFYLYVQVFNQRNTAEQKNRLATSFDFICDV